MLTTALTSKGQITIPKAVRESLQLSPGDKISFVISDDGEAVIRPLSKSASEMFGTLALKEDKKVSIEDMDEKVKQAFKDKKI